MKTSRTIRKVYLLVHPFGYLHDKPDSPYCRGHFDEYRAYGGARVGKWKTAITGFSDEDALFMLTTRGTTDCFVAAMSEFEEFAQSKLGPRFMVSRQGDAASEEFWQNLDSDFAGELTSEVKDIAVTCHGEGSVAVRALRSQLATMAHARDLKRALRDRGFSVDWRTVQGEAWGEAFEGCVARFAALLGRRLCLASPVEINYDMCLCPAQFIWKDAAFVERVSLNDTLRLFLFEAVDRRPIGLYTHIFYRPWDPPPSIRVPIEPRNVEVRNIEGVLCWPTTDVGSCIRPVAGGLQMPIGCGGLGHEPLYFIGKDADFNAFREALTRATIADSSRTRGRAHDEVGRLMKTGRDSR